MNKSHVGLGYQVCPICGKEHDETVLMQRFMGAPPRLKHRNLTGLSLCPEHAAMKEEYLALVEVSNAPPTGKTLTPKTALRTGNVAHVRRTVAGQLFSGVPLDLDFIYVEEGVIAKLQAMTQPEES